MKRTKMAQLGIVLVSILGWLLASAQSDYVILAKGDTIRGRVRYLNYGPEKKVQVTSDSNKKSTYSILHTKGFQLDNEVYHTVRVGQRYEYMKVVKTGYLSLYTFQLENQTTWDGRYLQKKDGRGLEVPNLGFKKRLAAFLNDCGDVSQSISEKEFVKSELETIVDSYNACISDRTMQSQKVIEVTRETVKKVSTLEELEKEISSRDFEEKTNSLEMVSEIKTKLQRSEKIPNFLIEGLKNALKDQSDLKELLEKTIQEIQN